MLATVVGAAATVFGLDRDRAFYPTVLIVIASYYALFAVMGGTMQALAVESTVAAVFLGASIAGFKSTLWLVVGALAAHGMFDLVHGHFISNPGVPVWWPAFCLTFDVTAAAYLAWLLLRRQVQAKTSRGIGDVQPRTAAPGSRRVTILADSEDSRCHPAAAPH